MIIWFVPVLGAGDMTTQKSLIRESMSRAAGHFLLHTYHAVIVNAFFGLAASTSSGKPTTR
ncbi:Uu.00g089070.m01.CDS01 [Anthostomella pinea]|uniref:Uu.00g089070.m01.CDS01 n=1 Tax=Anthostomella pinea TaxID=933095 RepID=A0AAI8VNK0_9PEZI|nr:Uu.00g089070.m01.CDS01 [Anthostomella pinea]